MNNVYLILIEEQVSMLDFIQFCFADKISYIRNLFMWIFIFDFESSMNDRLKCIMWSFLDLYSKLIEMRKIKRRRKKDERIKNYVQFQVYFFSLMNDLLLFQSNNWYRTSCGARHGVDLYQSRWAKMWWVSFIPKCRSAGISKRGSASTSASSF